MINIIFLCHEITKGMKSFGPKAIIPIGKKNNTEPLIIKQIKAIQKSFEQTPYRIHVVVGFEQDRVIKIVKNFSAKINIIKYNQYAESNSAGAVLDCLSSIKNGHYLFVENGILCDYKPKNNNSSLIPVLKKNNKNDKFTIGVTASDNKAEYMFYDLVHNKWPEILFVTEKDADEVRRISLDKSVGHMFLFEYINFLIESRIDFFIDKIANSQITKILNHKVSHNVNLPA